MNAVVIPFPGPKTAGQLVRYVTVDGEFSDDELPPELFDRGEDLSEMSLYVTLADHWND